MMLRQRKGDLSLSKARIGILGGTFDPIHLGHIQMALSVLEEVRLDQMLIMPSGSPPYKSCSAPSEDRWKMVVAACAGDARLVPTRLEMDRGGSVYTIDTLAALHREHPKADLFYVIGADALMKLHHWHRVEEILPLVTFLVCPRSGAADSDRLEGEIARLRALGASIRTVSMPLRDISSTVLRAALRRGDPTPMLDGALREYCGAKGLYGMPCRVRDADRWMDLLFEALTPQRFAHSLSVARTARRLAHLWQADPLRAEQAGLLHDCAKCLPLKEMRRIALEHALTDDPTVLDSGALLHSQVGAWLAAHDYGMTDPEVLEAIAWHNTGHPGMSRLAMCVCLADFMEPKRPSYPLLERVRALSEQSLERALLLSLEGTSDYVRSRGKFLHPRTQETIAWLKTLPAVHT